MKKTQVRVAVIPDKRESYKQEILVVSLHLFLAFSVIVLLGA